MSIQLHHADCFNILPTLKDESIDLIVIDPPYGIDYKSNHGSKAYKERLMDFVWDKSFDLSKYYSQLWRVLKPDSYMYVFGRIENFEVMRKLGFDRLLVWDKNHNGTGDLSDWGIGYEFIYCFRKGSPSIRGKRINGVIRSPSLSSMKFGNPAELYKHPTQKPEGIISVLIRKSSERGHTVLDCFMGSGTTGVVCKKLKRNFIGVEIEKKYYDTAKKRIDEVPESIDNFIGE